jgi:HprK-related kinase A
VLIGDYPRSSLARDLAHDGLHVVTGAFTFHLRIELPQLVEDFALMYAHFPIESPPGIDDASVRIAPPALRRHLFPRARVWIDGESPFRTVPAHRAYTALESSLNYCIAATPLSMLLVHGAVVVRDGRCLIMPGASGSGKSTLCAALCARGWRLFTDETALLSLRDGQMRANPRPVSLKNQSIGVLAKFAPELRMSRIFRGTPKGDIAYVQTSAEAAARAAEPAEPGLIVRPIYQAGASTNLRRLDKIEAFRLLADSAVNYSSLLRAGFDALVGVVDRCAHYELTYSDLEEAIRLILDLHQESRIAATARGRSAA